MPVIVDPAILAGYGRVPSPIDRDWLGRVTRLSAADVKLVRRRSDPVTQLGFAVQLAAVRAIGMFVPDVTQLPTPFVVAVADETDQNRGRSTVRASGDLSTLPGADLSRFWSVADQCRRRLLGRRGSAAAW